MILDLTLNEYIQQVKMCIAQCGVMDPAEREISHRRDETGAVWLIGRGNEIDQSGLFDAGAQPVHPFPLTKGGRIHLYIRIRSAGTTNQPSTRIANYRLRFLDIQDNENEIRSIRYDGDEGLPKSEGWDEDLQDNPHHPRFHAHVGFHNSPEANNLRLPTGFVNPILVIKAFDHWYE